MLKNERKKGEGDGMSTDMKTSNKYMSLAAITLAFSFTFLSRYIWSPLMADVSGEFGINATQAGLYMSAFFAGYLVTQIPGGIMADRYQPKYIHDTGRCYDCTDVKNYQLRNGTGDPCNYRYQQWLRYGTVL